MTVCIRCVAEERAIGCAGYDHLGADYYRAAVSSNRPAKGVGRGLSARWHRGAECNRKNRS
jgi:hypothetical protein